MSAIVTSPLARESSLTDADIASAGAPVASADVPRRSLGQLVRFGIVGGINTAIDFGIFSALRLAGFPLVPSNIAAASGAMAFSFLVNRRFVFGASGASWKRQAVLFLLGTGFSMFVLQNLVVLALQRFVPALDGPATAASHWLGIVPATATMLVRSIVAKGGAVAVSLVWNFSFYRWVVFAAPVAPPRKERD